MRRSPTTVDFCEPRDVLLTCIGSGSLPPRLEEDSPHGDVQGVSIRCKKHGTCDVILFKPGQIHNERVMKTGRFVWNGVAVALDVPKDDLDNVDVPFYCVPRGLGTFLDGI